MTKKTLQKNMYICRLCEFCCQVFRCVCWTIATAVRHTHTHTVDAWLITTVPRTRKVLYSNMRIFMNTHVYVCSLNIQIKAYTSRTHADLSGMLAYSTLHTLK